MSSTPHMQPSVRQSPRFTSNVHPSVGLGVHPHSSNSSSSRRPPISSPTFSTLAVDPMFASPALQPLRDTSHSPHIQAPGSGSGAARSSTLSHAHHGQSEFAHPAAVSQSPYVGPASAFGLMKSMNRAANDRSQPASTRSSRRNSLTGNENESKAAAAAASSATHHTANSTSTNPHQLRSATTSPTIPSRSIPGIPSPTASPHFGGVAHHHYDPFDTPSLGGLSASKSRYTHGLSKPLDSPFLIPSRRSPRGHSPISTSFQPMMSPSPGFHPASQSHSPNISFALPSPSLMGIMNTPGLTSTSHRMGERDLSGGLNMQSQSSIFNSHIFQNWEGESLGGVRRSPRFGPGQAPASSSSSSGLPLNASRRSPSLNMFSPPSYGHAGPTHHAHGAHHHHLPDSAAVSGGGGAGGAGGHHTRDHSTSSNPAAASSSSAGHNLKAPQGGGSRSHSASSQNRTLRDGTPQMVPSSPNLSLLGKLRSMNNQPGDQNNADSMPFDPLSRSMSPALKLEDSAGHNQRKRNRGDYEASPYQAPATGEFPYSSGGLSSGHKMSGSLNTPNFSHSGMGLTSPAMVGSLPPSRHGQSLDRMGLSPDWSNRGNRNAGHGGGGNQHGNNSHAHNSHHNGGGNQSRDGSDQKRFKPNKKHHDAPIPRIPRLSAKHGANGEGEDQGGDSSTVENGAMPILPAGSGSSCHQCKSRRMVVDLIYCCNMNKKGRDKKVAPTATSSAAHSCRKKYCQACLGKFYNERPPAKKFGPAGVNIGSPWACPACRGICCCAACRRIKARQLGEIDPTQLTPAALMAYSYVYCKDVLHASMGGNDEEEDAEDGDGHGHGHHSNSHTPGRSHQHHQQQHHHQHHQYHHHDDNGDHHHHGNASSSMDHDGGDGHNHHHHQNHHHHYDTSQHSGGKYAGRRHRVKEEGEEDHE